MAVIVDVLLKGMSPSFCHHPLETNRKLTIVGKSRKLGAFPFVGTESALALRVSDGHTGGPEGSEEGTDREVQAGTSLALLVWEMTPGLRCSPSPWPLGM